MIEYLATITGLIALYLISRGIKFGWWLNIVSCILYLIVNFQYGLIGMGLGSIIYLLLSINGLYKVSK
jgi:nicotinamide riboside transporter PnuC